MLRLALLIAALLATTAGAQDRDVIAGQFANWIEQTVWPLAQGQNVTRPVFDAAFAGVTLDWDLPDLVPPGTTAPPTQQQAEFRAPGAYFARSSLDSATSVGQQMAERHAAALDAIGQETGVPGHILLAIWGRESSYGRAAIPHNAFRVLATKGFMSTRADYFTQELIAALRIAQEGHVPAAAMKSSWAGALGQPQFMPSNFLAYAADGDGDGRADIWGSVPDTLASIAAYLVHHGWVTGRDWGFEVVMPAAVSCTLEGPDQGRPIAEWAAMGITRVGGKAFPVQELSGEGFLLMPAGRAGPAFVVTPNFYVLKTYNISDVYALFVGHAGDRIAYGQGDFVAPWQPVSGLDRADVRQIQRALIAQGHDVGGADGLAGYKTRRSIGRWQEGTDQTATCFPDAAMTATLRP